jgi:hypothetical protein
VQRSRICRRQPGGRRGIGGEPGAGSVVAPGGAERVGPRGRPLHLRRLPSPPFGGAPERCFQISRQCLRSGSCASAAK